LIFKKISGKRKKVNHGYEPQSKLWKQIPQQAAGYYNPPLCGIVQLTNFAALRFRNWSFTNNDKEMAQIKT
jgi:hypothetical protein